MNTLLSLTHVFRNRVKVWTPSQSVEGLNLVTYHGGDVLAQLLAGNTQFKISHIAFEYENTAGTPAPAPAARTDTVATILTPLAGTFDYLRAPLSAVPTLGTTDGNHTSNLVTFTATSTASLGQHGVAFGAGSNSKVYSISLLAAPTGAAAGDVMFARFILPSALPAVGAGQVSATWSVSAN